MKNNVSKKIYIGLIILLVMCVGLVLGFGSSYSKKVDIFGESFKDLLLNGNSVIEDLKMDGLLYDKEKEEYYFRGNVENNYVLVNDDIWRVVSFDDKGIKIIKEEGIESNKLIKFDEDFSNYDYNKATINEVLSEWYEENLLNIDKKMEKVNSFCIKYEEECTETQISEIGLLDYYEVIRAGGDKFSNNDGYYLYNGFDWWIIESYYDEVIGASFTGYVNKLGSIDSGFVDEEMTVRPVVILKADVNVSGEGTFNTPYIITK